MWLLLAALAAADPAPATAWIGLGAGTAAPVLLGVAIGSAGVDKPSSAADAVPAVGTPAYYEASRKYKAAQRRMGICGGLGLLGMAVGPPMLAAGSLSARGDASPVAGYTSWGLWGTALAGMTTAVVLTTGEGDKHPGAGVLFLGSSLVYLGSLTAGILQLEANGAHEIPTMVLPVASGRF